MASAELSPVPARSAPGDFLVSEPEQIEKVRGKHLRSLTPQTRMQSESQQKPFSVSLPGAR